MSSNIQSDRLDLISFTPAFIRASLDGDVAQAETLIQLSLPPGWPSCTDSGWPDCSDMLRMRLGQLEDDPSVQPWLVRAMVARDGVAMVGAMVGYIGFHTAPGAEYLRPYSPEAVEFGYTVFPPHRRQGYAREASCALMRWATEHHGVRRFVLSISPDNAASQSLAASLGFVRIGSHLDEVDGIEDVLEYDSSAANAPDSLSNK